MTVKELFALFRSEVHDEELPTLWSDTEIYSYMDDAQKMFCRMEGGIADSTSPVTRVTVTAGKKFGTYDPRILKLRLAQRASDFTDVEVLNFEDLQHKPLLTRYNDYGYQITKHLTLDEKTGPVNYIITGMERNKVRFVYIPEVDDTLNLIVYRLPLDTISKVTEECDLEIDEQHHRHLLDWMKHLAYGKQDAETYDKTKHLEFGAKFTAYCEQARQERERREHKYRSVLYGGI